MTSPKGTALKVVTTEINFCRLVEGFVSQKVKSGCLRSRTMAKGSRDSGSRIEVVLQSLWNWCQFDHCCVKNRIGCLKSGIVDVKNHAFFSFIDWDDVYHKKESPPIKPKVSVMSSLTQMLSYNQAYMSVILASKERCYFLFAYL